MRDVSLVPFVCGAGASLPGCEYGPIYCVEHGLSERLHDHGIVAEWSVDPHQHWSGPYGQAAQADLPARGSIERHEIVRWHNQALALNVAQELRNGRRVVTIGGDHSMAAGSISGAGIALGTNARIGVLWIDAHPDLHTAASSVSKALHGMPMGTILGLDQTLAVQGCAYPVIRPDNIIFAGLRDIDEGERRNAESLGLVLPSINDLRQMGIARYIQEQVTLLMHRCDHILLSIDLDGFSNDLTPAVGTPVSGGFLAHEIIPTLAGIVRSCSVPLIDIVEFNPTLHGAEKTYDFIVESLTALLPSNAV